MNYYTNINYINSVINSLNKIYYIVDDLQSELFNNDEIYITQKLYSGLG